MIVLDLGLPDMDGVEVIRGLRGGPGCRSSCCPPATPPTRRSARSTRGADDYVTKPFRHGRTPCPAARRSAPGGAGGRRRGRM
ncbi:hypothetical protein AB7952_04955 [Streptomyces sp. PG2]